MGVKYTPEQLAGSKAGQRSLPGLATTSLGQLAPRTLPAATLHPGVRPLFYIGLDPGVNTGFAIWQPKLGAIPGRFIEVSALSFVATVRRLEKLCREFGPGKLRVRIENPQGNLPTFREHGEQGNAAVREKMSQNIGSNKRDAQLLMDFLQDLNIPFDALTPKKKAAGTGKIQHEFFHGMPGFPSRSNQHARDAAYLVFNF